MIDRDLLRTRSHHLIAGGGLPESAMQEYARAVLEMIDEGERLREHGDRMSYAVNACAEMAQLAEADADAIAEHRDRACDALGALMISHDGLRAERDAAIARAEKAEADAEHLRSRVAEQARVIDGKEKEQDEIADELSVLLDTIRDNLPEYDEDGDGEPTANESLRVEYAGAQIEEYDATIKRMRGLLERAWHVAADENETDCADEATLASDLHRELWGMP